MNRFNRTRVWVPLLAATLFSVAVAQAQEDRSAALTIYNQDFAVVRNLIPLDLKGGANHLDVTDITSKLEPDSVILRDLSGRSVQILEQNYRNDAVSQQMLLQRFEGKTIDFLQTDSQGRQTLVQGKIIRAGFAPDGGYPYSGYYGQPTAASPSSPLIEVNGRLQFSLPGMPLFPSLQNDNILKPTLSWLLQTPEPGDSKAEFSYVTGGLSWHADYNIVAPPQGDVLNLVGWVTLRNESGMTFNDANIKLIAGNVNKLQPQGGYAYAATDSMNMVAKEAAAPPPVTERSFDEYHLYTLERPTSLLDRETKQVEFVESSGIQSKRIYVYDGAAGVPLQSYNYSYANTDPNYGAHSNSKIWVMQEFKNSKENHLGIALPAGRIRFYRRDQDGQLEFTGENTIDHTPTDETIRLYTGNTFDVVGERRQTNFHVNSSAKDADEAFTIAIRNHKKTAVDVRVVEHLYRWYNWKVYSNSAPYTKKDAQTIEFALHIPAGGTQTVDYNVEYSW